MEANINLEKMLIKAMHLDDIVFGYQAFGRENLVNKISDKDQINMIKKAIASGKSLAKEIKAKYNFNNLEELSSKLKVKITYSDKTYDQANMLLFAFYNSKNLITINKKAVDTALSFKEMKTLSKDYFSKKTVTNLLIGHEIYHFLENNNKNLYSNTERITLFKIFKWQYRARIHILGEIAAMSFAKELNNVTYNPFILDILLVYGFNKSSASALYQDLILSEERVNSIMEGNDDK